MKRFAFVLILCLAATGIGLAQQSQTDPASREDVERYLQVMHSNEMLNKMVEAMLQPMHQMVHDDYVKNQNKLSQDFEVRMNKVMDDMMRDMPWDQILQSMVPVYQKHFTKGELDDLIVFYSSSTGQKVIREMPSIMGDAMQAMMPLMRQHVETIRQNVEQEVAQMLKESPKKAGQGQAVERN